MFNPLPTALKRVVVDTNVLLDAAFVPGDAGKAISLLEKMGISLIIDDMMEIECIRVISQFSLRDVKKKHAISYFCNFLSSKKFLRLPPANLVDSAGVNQSDAHVVRSAKYYDAWVLTGDHALIVQLRDVGVEARYPIDVIMSYSDRNNSEVDINDMMRIVTPRRESGLLFGRVIAGNWAGLVSSERFTVCSIENIGVILYDSKFSGWVFEMATGAVVRIRHDISYGDEYAVCGSYFLGRSGMKISIRVGDCFGYHGVRSYTTLKKISASTPGEVSIGNIRGGGESWGSTIKRIVVGPQGMNRKTWRNIMSIPNGSPNPYDSGALRRVFEALSLRDGRAGNIVLPTMYDLRRLRL